MPNYCFFNIKKFASMTLLKRVICNAGLTLNPVRNSFIQYVLYMCCSLKNLRSSESIFTQLKLFYSCTENKGRNYRLLLFIGITNGYVLT